MLARSLQHATSRRVDDSGDSARLGVECVLAGHDSSPIRSVPCAANRQVVHCCVSPWHTKPVRHATLQSALILPVQPVHIMKLKVTGNGDANCRKEEALAELREQSEPLELVLYGILELG